YNGSGYGAFAPGWAVLGGKKDVSDYEWAVWAPYLYFSVPWVCANLLGAEIVRYFCKELLAVWYLTLSAMYILLHMGALSLVSMLMEPCLMFTLLQLRSRAVLYIGGFILLVLHNTDFKFAWLPISYDSQYLLMISTAWIYMRCQSYCHDALTSGQVSASLTDLITLLGYSLYFPMLFLGPLILFDEFQTGLRKPYVPWTLRRVKMFILNIMRFCWWAIFLEAMTHFLYISALQGDLKHMSRQGAWAHYGLGFGMGIVFQLKYVVTYGFNSTVAQAERYQAPRHPKCIGRIHLYSDMWKYFDEGLYNFLRKYVYMPLLRSSYSLLDKKFASLACFVFIYAWHRVYLFVLVWSTLNYLGVTLESLGRSIGNSTAYQHYEKMVMITPQNVRRLHAVLGTPLLIMSALSNFYFFAGMRVGNYYVKRLLA
ncbi:hypothetical protein L9F63_026126, partial [Diploptera punctata]